MLNIFGQQHGGFCDRQSRRNFIKVGALGLGGLNLPQLLRAQKETGSGRSNKAIIMLPWWTSYLIMLKVPFLLGSCS